MQLAKQSIVHNTLRKNLFTQVYGYSLPLYHPNTCKFELREPHRWRNCPNAWKESFIQLRHGVHVRPGAASLYSHQPGRPSLAHFDSIEPALRFVATRPAHIERLVFLHAGHHYPNEVCSG